MFLVMSYTIGIPSDTDLIRHNQKRTLSTHINLSNSNCPDCFPPVGENPEMRREPRGYNTVSEGSVRTADVMPDVSTPQSTPLEKYPVNLS